MNSGRTVFAQLMDHLPAYEFSKCVERYRGDRRLRGFSCWDQFLALAFAQLTYRESLRDIEACLRSVQPKLYHVGFRGKVSRSTLADADHAHDWRIYADFALRGPSHGARFPSIERNGLAGIGQRRLTPAAPSVVVRSLTSIPKWSSSTMAALLVWPGLRLRA